MDYLAINSAYWDQYSRQRGPWSRRVSPEVIQRAREGRVEIAVTTGKTIPEDWLPKNWRGLDVLGLASGGGQQMPVLVATGAKVTSFDLSAEQLERDLEVCREEGLTIKTEQGHMEELTPFSDESFDFVFNPVSTCFTRNVKKVWREVARVLRPGGLFISAFNNPVVYALDDGAYDDDKKMHLINSIPRQHQDDDSIEFSHSLESLIGGQTEVGLTITGLYEDYWGEGFNELIDTILPQFIVTRATRARIENSSLTY